MYTKRIAVLGAGISGITTALTLQLLGFTTTCYARELVPGDLPESDEEEDPRFASLFPAASIIPHSIEAGGRLTPLFTVSQKVFGRLSKMEFPGLCRHRHYEVFEFPRSTPTYVSLLQNPEELKDNDPALPRRPGSGDLYGWSFNCHFTEWPDYISALYNRYRKAGGEIIRRELNRKGIEELEEETVVNCTGIWSPFLFEDPPRDSLPVERGHLVVIPGAPLYRDEGDRIISYNYSPMPSVYSDPEGNACDVYFYPRSNGWVIGGSRQRGQLDASGHWEGNSPADTVTMNGLEVPRAVLELNTEILRHTYGLDTDGYGEKVARMGYRYMGEPAEGGLNLKSERQFGKKIIHNTGHGGAGVTLSWGCAVASSIMIRREAGNRYAEGLNEVCLQLIDALHTAFS